MAEPKLPPLPAIDPDERIVTMPERFTGAALAYTPARESGMPAAPAPGPRSAAPARTTRPPLWLFMLLGIVVLGAVGGGAWWFMLRTPAAPAPAANANANRPAANRNANTPVIRNANQNINAPSSAGSNANVPVATTTPATTTSTPPAANANVPQPPAGPVRVASDADADGLTDVEETEIYHSDPGRPDTDGDGYLDGVEVLNLYNPSATAPVTLRESGSVTVAAEADAGYELLAPAPWRRQVIDVQSGAIAWTALDGEFVQLLVQENADALPLTDWYLAQAPGVARAQVTAFTTRSGLAGIRSPDGFTSFIALSPTRVLIVSYSLGGRTEAGYRRSYEMMANAVKLLVPAPSGVEGPASGSTSTP